MSDVSGSADLRLDQKIDCEWVLAPCCIGGVSGDTMKLCACCTARLYNQCDDFASVTFGLKAELGSNSMDRTWCILFCLQNGTLIRPADRFVIDCRTPVPAILCRSESMEEAGSWRRLIWS
jgi:hypothetical protein